VRGYGNKASGDAKGIFIGVYVLCYKFYSGSLSLVNREKLHCLQLTLGFCYKMLCLV